MKAVILAGGKGARLAPYTAVFPKPLVPLGNRPILDIIIRQLLHFGFHDITLSVGYLAELLQSYIQTSMSGANVNITYVKEEKPMGTAGSLRLIPDLDETFLVMNGDVLTSLDFSKLVEYHKRKEGDLTIAMYTKKVKIDLGVIESDENDIVTGYIEKPEKEYMVSMGVYVYEPTALEYIEPDAYFDFPDLVLRLIENNRKVVCCRSFDYWLDIGSHEDYAKAQDEFEHMKDILLPGNEETTGA